MTLLQPHLGDSRRQELRNLPLWPTFLFKSQLVKDGEDAGHTRPSHRPRYQLTRGLIGLDNEKDDMTSCCLGRKLNTMCHLANAQYWDRPAGGNTGRLFLAFGGPVCADRISNCPLDRVLTYKNLIYLFNLQFSWTLARCLRLLRKHSVPHGKLVAYKSYI